VGGLLLVEDGLGKILLFSTLRLVGGPNLLHGYVLRDFRNYKENNDLIAYILKLG
jgi:hypothetical protein